MRLFLSVLTFLFLNQAMAVPLGSAEVVKIALRNSPQVKKSQAELAAARARTKSERGRLFPKISGVGSAGTSETGSNSDSSGSSKEYAGYLEATQPLFAGGAISAGIDVLKANETIAELEFKNARLDVVSGALERYYDAVESLRLLTAAEENLRIQKDYVTIIRRYAKIGRARRTDQMQAQVNLLNAEADVNNLNSKFRQSLSELRRWLVLDANTAVELITKIPMPKSGDLSEIKAIERALAANPDYLIEREKQKRVEKEKTLALSDDLPSLDLTGRFGYRATDESHLFTAGNEFSSATINLTFPIFSGLSSIYERRAYNEAKEAQVREVEAKRLELTAQIEKLILETRESQKRLELVRTASAEARRALDMANRDYQKNLISTQDVISLQRTRYDTESLLVRTEMSFLKNILSIRKAMGMDLEGLYTQP